MVEIICIGILNGAILKLDYIQIEKYREVIRTIHVWGLDTM